MKTAYLFCVQLLLLLFWSNTSFAGVDGNLHGTGRTFGQIEAAKQLKHATAHVDHVHRDTRIAEPEILLSAEDEDEDLVKKLAIFARYALIFCLVLAMRLVKDDPRKLPFAYLHLQTATPRFLFLRVIRL